MPRTDSTHTSPAGHWANSRDGCVAGVRVPAQECDTDREPGAQEREPDTRATTEISTELNRHTRIREK